MFHNFQKIQTRYNQKYKGVWQNDNNNEYLKKFTRGNSKKETRYADNVPKQNVKKRTLNTINKEFLV